MKNYFSYLFVLLVFLSGCDSKQCTCPTNMTCYNSKCVCIPGYEGSNCDIHSVDKFIKIYRVYGNCIPFDFVSEIRSNVSANQDISAIKITNFLNKGIDIIGYVDNTTITIPAQTSENISGTGFFNPNDNKVTLNLSYYDISIGNDKMCTVTYIP
jgi:hypothetical protein